MQFRKTIAERITSILKISHKDTEVVFDHTAREVEAAIAAVELPAETRRTVEEKTHLTANTSKIVAAWMEIESAVRERLSRAGVDVASLSAAALLQMAQERKLITGEQMRALVGLNAMRNLAVHGREGEINAGRVKEFTVLADAMKTVLSIA